PPDVEITAGSVFDLDTARRFEDLGADRLMCPLMLPDMVITVDDAKRRITEFADGVMSQM
ncbi:MAG: hypothetical protein ACRBK7_29330, partial [Acidimicrobiales bacterium]